MTLICAGHAFLNELKVKEKVHKLRWLHILKHPLTKHVRIWVDAGDREYFV